MPSIFAVSRICPATTCSRAILELESMQPDFAERARALIGTAFRPQGRETYGLDCVGLILRTFDLPADSVRRDYCLKGDHRDEVFSELKRLFRKVTMTGQRPG